MTRTVIKAAVVAIATLVPALARAEMPTYGVEAYCKQLSEMGGSSQSLLNGCLRMEQSAYDKLKPGWDALPAALRRYCDGLAVTGGGSYSLLDGCVRLEQDAQKRNGEFKFNR